MAGTDSLRELAPRWSLAGDERLLDILQNTHQRIVSRCLEVNTKMDEMSTALDSACINLQNVNNRFMALSNSQFIESRVYDDDGDVTMETKPVEKPITPEPVDELILLKRSLAVLDGAHELTEILDDSDTDDSDAQISVVLKPKDAYAHRPLPYIIGSQAWKNKWHAGLLVEESDSDSVTSKPDLMMEEYSESEDDVQVPDKLVPDATISETSSSFHSGDKDLMPEKKTPADIAAELAARLGNAPPRVLEEPADLPQSTPKPVYRPQKPAPSNIFSDEPPPLDYQEQYSDTQDDDIFAEINKKQPYTNNNTSQNIFTDDLFGTPVKDYEERRSVKQKPTLFDEDSEPELFGDKPTKEESCRSKQNEDNIKKPVGGISLFGLNKGTESIGAAILKRNVRKSISSDDESDEDRNNIKNDTADDYVDTNNANYIFDNLFAKAKQAEQKLAKQVDKPVKEMPKQKEIKENVKPKEITKKPESKEIKDLFSDNIFDDIDDIFTSNIKIPTKEASKKAKSIFDDDDDLFSDIAKTPKKTIKDKATNSSKKSVFDSDDELFSDVKVTKDAKIDEAKEKPKKRIKTESQTSKTIETNNNTTKVNKETSLFDDSKQIESNIKPKDKSKSIFDSDSDDDLFSDVKVKTSKIEKESKSKLSDTESDLFKEIKPPTKTDLLRKNETAIVTDTLITEKSKVFQSPSLFEEDEIDDLFINANKVKIPNVTENAVEHKIPENLPDVVNKNELTEENLDFNDKKDNRSNLDNKNKENIVENKKPVIIDTKSIVFPKIDDTNASNEFNNDETAVESTNVTDRESSPVKVQKINSIGRDLGAKFQEPEKNTETEITSIEKESISPKTQELFSGTSKETSKYKINEDEISKVNAKHDVLTQQKTEIPIATFEDIITEPPAFEKTKEVKKITNVNALFEDDSDDEALFFKKNDVISDEKPDVFSPSANFGIFNDEPPAFVDFSPKRHENDDLFGSITKDDVDVTKQSDDEWNDDAKNDRPPKINHNNIDNNIFGSTEKNIDTTKKFSKEIPESDEELFSSIKTKNDPIPKSEPTKDSIDQLDDIIKDRKIGKINTKNLNINVQALVPGASPKKIPKDLNENTKITNIDNTTEETHTKDIESDNAEPKTVKSISFENKPASGVLDNNLSKQRPRIQVKRRPSSRKARHEAVRKSVIDLDDETDNSSSFDELLPKLNQNKSLEHKNQDQVKTIDSFTDEFSSFDEPVPTNRNISKETNEYKNQDPIHKNTDKLFDDLGSFDDPVPTNKDKSKELQKNQDNILKTSTIDELLDESKDKYSNTSKTDKSSEFESNAHKNKVSDTIDNKTHLPKVDINDLLNSDDTFKQQDIKDVTQNLDEVDANVKINETKVLNEDNQSTTKVKYILNDEDIFSKSPDDNLLKQTESDDDIFKNKGIKTIGKTYKNTQREMPKQESTSQSITQAKHSISKTVQHKKESKSLFDISDDDGDLFGKVKTKKVETKSKLFDSDSEDDLFSGKKKVKEDKKVEVKVGGSLFGDDDDDLFGAKSKKTAIVPTKASASSSRSDKKDTKSTEVVFDDPLSMLDDD